MWAEYDPRRSLTSNQTVETDFSFVMAYIHWMNDLRRCRRWERASIREFKLSIMSCAVRLLFEPPERSLLESTFFRKYDDTFLWENRNASHLVIVTCESLGTIMVQRAWVWSHVCGCGYKCIGAYPLLGAYSLTISGYRRMRLLTRFYGSVCKTAGVVTRNKHGNWKLGYLITVSM